MSNDMGEVTIVGKIKEKSKAAYSFPKADKVQPKGWSNVQAGTEITIITKGRVKEVRDTPNGEWNPGKRIEMELKSCEIIGKEKKITLEDAIKASKKKA